MPIEDNEIIIDGTIEPIDDSDFNISTVLNKPSLSFGKEKGLGNYYHIKLYF